MSFDPSIGRWISEDPRGFRAGDYNLDRYVLNDPTNLVDPSGCDPVVSGGYLEARAPSDEKRKLDRATFEKTINTNGGLALVGKPTMNPADLPKGVQPVDVPWNEVDTYRLDKGCIGVTSIALMSNKEFLAQWQWLWVTKYNSEDTAAAKFRAFVDALNPFSDPNNVDGAWDKFADAKIVKGGLRAGMPPLRPGDKVVVFAIQAHPNGNKPNVDRRTGRVSTWGQTKSPIKFSSDMKDVNLGRFNFNVYVPSANLQGRRILTSGEAGG